MVPSGRAISFDHTDNEISTPENGPCSASCIRGAEVVKSDETVGIGNL